MQLQKAARPQPIMLKFLPIMLLSIAQKFAHYAYINSLIFKSIDCSIRVYSGLGMHVTTNYSIQMF